MAVDYSCLAHRLTGTNWAIGAADLGKSG